MNPESLIQNYEAVVMYFGHWPAFHDAKVCSYEGPKASVDSASFTLQTWQMTDEVDANGYIVLENHALISFRFDGLFDAHMDTFSSGNILFGMDFVCWSGAGIHFRDSRFCDEPVGHILCAVG